MHSHKKSSVPQKKVEQTKCRAQKICYKFLCCTYFSAQCFFLLCFFFTLLGCHKCKGVSVVQPKQCHQVAGKDVVSCRFLLNVELSVYCTPVMFPLPVYKCPAAWVKLLCYYRSHILTVADTSRIIFHHAVGIIYIFFLCRCT